MAQMIACGRCEKHKAVGLIDGAFTCGYCAAVRDSPPEPDQELVCAATFVNAILSNPEDRTETLQKTRRDLSLALKEAGITIERYDAYAYELGEIADSFCNPHHLMSVHVHTRMLDSAKICESMTGEDGILTLTQLDHKDERGRHFVHQILYALNESWCKSRAVAIFKAITRPFSDRGHGVTFPYAVTFMGEEADIGDEMEDIGDEMEDIGDEADIAARMSFRRPRFGLKVGTGYNTAAMTKVVMHFLAKELLTLANWDVDYNAERIADNFKTELLKELIPYTPQINKQYYWPEFYAQLATALEFEFVAVHKSMSEPRPQVFAERKRDFVNRKNHQGSPNVALLMKNVWEMFLFYKADAEKAAGTKILKQKGTSRHQVLDDIRHFYSECIKDYGRVVMQPQATIEPMFRALLEVLESQVPEDKRLSKDVTTAPRQSQ